MSSLAAVLDPNRALASTALRRLLDALPGPEGATRTWAADGVGVGVRDPRAGAADQIDEGFLADPETGVVVAVDGRVDARERLASQLERAGSSPRSNTSAEFVLRSYLSWKERCPERILGEYAFVLWDPEERRLMCARDVSGVRPLFYARGLAGSLWFGTNPRQLLTAAEVRPTIDREGFVDLLLARGSFLPDRTLCAAIRRVPPGSTLSVADGRERVRQHASYAALARTATDPDPDPDALATSLQAAIGDRVRGAGAAGLLLSGGWDSGAILALWASMRARESGMAAPVAFTHYPDDEADERPAVVERLKQWSVRGRFVPLPAGAAMFDGLLDHLDTIGMPETAAGWRAQRSIARLARAEGLRVCLNGNGGDAALSTPYAKVVNLLLTRGPRRASEQVRLLARESGASTAHVWSSVLRSVPPGVAPGLWSAVRRTPFGTRAARSWGVLGFLSPELRALAPDVIACATSAYRRNFGVSQLVSSEIAFHMERLSRQLHVDSPVMHAGGLTGAEPYMDTRVVQAAMRAAVADRTPAHPRALLRRAVERGSGRPFQGNYVHLDRWLGECLRSGLESGVPWMTPIALGEAGLLNVSAFRKAVVQSLAAQPRARPIHLPHIWQVASAEAWAQRWL